VPAQLLRLAGGALRDHDVDESGAWEVHRSVDERKLRTPVSLRKTSMNGKSDERRGKSKQHRLYAQRRTCLAQPSVERAERCAMIGRNGKVQRISSSQA
jgi:hypothetical protein